MQNDNDSKHFNASTSKSFVKKPKPKLTTPFEDDEMNDNLNQQGNKQSTMFSKDSLDNTGMYEIDFIDFHMKS